MIDVDAVSSSLQLDDDSKIASFNPVYKLGLLMVSCVLRTLADL